MSFEKISREGFDYVNLECYIEGNKFCVAVGNSIEGQDNSKVEEAQYAPERKEDASMRNREKNTVARDVNGTITIHITTEAG